MAETSCPEFSPLTDAVHRWALTAPERTAIVFLADGEREAARLTYSDLDTAVVRAGERLADSLEPGSRIVLCFPSGAEFVIAFLACLYAGIIAVPVGVPGDSRRASRLAGVVSDCDAAAVLTEAPTAENLEMRSGEPFLGLPWSVVDAAARPAAGDGWRPRKAPDDIAFLQYTSGSTGSPKGVVVTHANLADNISVIMRRTGVGPDSAMLSWLPVFHDLGLIGCVLTPLLAGISTVLMPPMAFLREPLRWPRALSKYRSTITMAPNFGYEICNRRAGTADLSGIDLAPLRTAVNSAEPLRMATMETFTRLFEPVGFRRASFYPGYGLAEATLYVSGRHLCSPAGVPLDRTQFAYGRVVPVPEGEDGRLVVNCGRPGPGQTLVIVDPETEQECPADAVGEIWIAGGNVTQGYWNHEAAAPARNTAALPGHPGTAFLRTGDLGFLLGGDVFVTGRIKDVIVVGGQNHYPHDIEATVEGLATLRPRGVAAFPVTRDGIEGVGIAAEVVGGRIRGDLAAIARSIAEAVWHEHSLSVAEVALLKPGRLPKTTSGKLRRRGTRELLEADELGELCRWPERRDPARSPGLQDGGLAARDPGRLASLLVSGSAADAERVMVDVVRAQIAEVLGLSSVDAVRADGSPQAVGLDSIRVIELSASLSAVLGFQVPVDLLRSCDSPAAVGSALVRRALVRLATGSGQAGSVTSTPRDGMDQRGEL